MRGKKEYYVMYEAVLYDGTPVWIGISDEGIEIINLKGDMLKEYKTTYDPRMSLCTIQ